MNSSQPFERPLDPSRVTSMSASGAFFRTDPAAVQTQQQFAESMPVMVQTTSSIDEQSFVEPYSPQGFASAPPGYAFAPQSNAPSPAGFENPPMSSQYVGYYSQPPPTVVQTTSSFDAQPLLEPYSPQGFASAAPGYAFAPQSNAPSPAAFENPPMSSQYVLYSSQPPPEVVAPPPVLPPAPAPQPRGFTPTMMPHAMLNKTEDWRFGMFRPCTPMQCFCGVCCPWVVTLEMISYAAPFELVGWGCIVTKESAIFLTFAAWLFWFSSFGIFFALMMLSIATGIKKKFLIKEDTPQTLLKICCCFSCFQIQMLRECEQVGAAIGVTQLYKY